MLNSNDTVTTPTRPPISADAADYRLTWPGDKCGVATVAGQWQRNEEGDIEAWYSAEQLGACLVAMQDIESTK